MLEAKGFGYATFIGKNGEWKEYFKKGKEKLEDQLYNQAAAAGSRKIEWHVAEESVADKIRSMIVEMELPNVTVEFDPDPWKKPHVGL